MNIEYKFRGQTCKEYPCDKKQGEWVYGGIVHQTDYYGEKCDKYFIIDGTTSEDNDIGFSYLVDSETVGQYIGIKDILSKEVYTGDILFYFAPSKEEDITKLIGTVDYYNWWGENASRYICCIDNKDFFDLWIPQKYLIIWNKFDNPELLKGDRKLIYEKIKKILDDYIKEWQKTNLKKEIELYKKKWAKGDTAVK